MASAAPAKTLKNVAQMVAILFGSQAKHAARVDPAKLQPMIYPYTWSACAIQFPHVFFLKQCWWPRYYLYANILCYPLWVWIHFKVNSPEAKLAWEDKKKEDFRKEHMHEWEVL